MVSAGFLWYGDYRSEVSDSLGPYILGQLLFSRLLRCAEGAGIRVSVLDCQRATSAPGVQNLHPTVSV